MQLITAPSKTQEFNGRNYSHYTLPALEKKAQIIIDRLKPIAPEELSLLMKTSEKLTISTYRRIQDFIRPFSLTNARQALFTFQGDAYSAIKAESYTEEQLHQAQNHLFILSGLYGILRPLDLMQPYRLEMATKLAVDDATNLYHFWRDQVTKTLNSALKKNEDGLLVNLASTEYSKVVDKKSLQGDMVTITFQQMYKDKYRTIPIHSKKARGLMIHFAIINKINRGERLKDFNLDGYGFSEELSTAQEWFFLRQ